jgi:FixJ family two-component response regulator
VLTKEPTNKQFAQYLEKSEEKLKKIREEAYEKMTRSVMFTDLVQMGFEE